MASLKFSVPKLPAVPEAAYRSRFLRRDITRVTVSIVVAMLILTVFAYRDYQFLGISWQFFALSFGRLVFTVITILVLVKLRKTTDYRLYDRLLAYWLFLVFSGDLLIDVTRPSTYFVNAVLDVVFVVTAYIMLPSKLRNLIILCSYFSVASLLLLYFTRDATVRPALFTIAAAFVLANVMGIIAAWMFNYYRMSDYLSEETARKALAEVKALKGFLPICSSCKKIRDDQGYWQAVDHYISEHTDAEFTHGICPECMARLYPGLVPEKQDKPSE
jgi:hypothetical protein